MALAALGDFFCVSSDALTALLAAFARAWASTLGALMITLATFAGLANLANLAILKEFPRDPSCDVRFDNFGSLRIADPRGPRGEHANG